MINFDGYVNENKTVHNKNWPYIPFRIIIIGGLGSGKTNSLINLKNEPNDIDKIYLYARDLYEPKYEYLIKKREDVGIKHLSNPNAFIECSDTMDYVYDNIDDYNSNRRRKILIVFDEIIAGIMTNRRFQAIIKKLFIRSRKLNISLVFITQSYFSFPKDVRLNSTHYLIIKINNRKELQSIAINHSTYIDYKDFIKIYRECTKEPFNFLIIDTALPGNHPLIFRKNLFDFYIYKRHQLQARYKNDRTDQIKILDKKIMQNERQYDLDRKSAKISALSSNILDKYEYLTGEDLGLKTSVIEQTKFQYSPFNKIFNKGLGKDDQKEGLFKRLKILKIKMKSN